MTSAIPMDLALFFVATFLGAVVAGVAGFAFGLIASAIWLHIISPAQSAPLIAAFAILIQGRERVIGFHLPFPGIGIVERSGSSYRFVPA